MKKVALLGLLSVAVMASESGLYIGAEVGSTHTKAADIISGNEEKASSNRISEGLNIGYYLNDNSRAYLAYQYINADMDKEIPEKTKIYSAGYDYLFGTSAFKPFVGAIIGYSSYKDGTFKVTGMSYGAQVGVDYKINANISVDAGYRYLDSNAKGTNYSGGKSPIYSFQTFFAGANYKF